MSFSLLAVNIDQGHPGYPGHLLTEYMRPAATTFGWCTRTRTASSPRRFPQGKTYCSLCSRLRRGILYRLATELGCTKIALGHHRDDVVVTLLLNLFFSGQLKAMPPKLISDDGAHTVIRPLVYCAEDDIAAYAARQGFRSFPAISAVRRRTCSARSSVDSSPTSSASNPGLRTSALAALMNVRPSHLLDAGLWKKLGLEVARESAPETVASETAPTIPLSALRRAVARSG